MTDTPVSETTPAFNATDLSTQLPADATLADLVGRVNALSAAVLSGEKSALTADQLSAINKITAFFSV